MVWWWARGVWNVECTLIFPFPAPKVSVTKPQKSHREVNFEDCFEGSYFCLQMNPESGLVREYTK